MMTMIDINNVMLSFNGLTRPILYQLSCQIEKGDFIILLGSNGSGKSTLLKLLSRQYQTNSGYINLLNKPIHEYTAKTFARLVSILTQNSSDSLFTSLTLYENYLLIKNQFTLVRDDIEKQKLSDYLFNFNINLGKKINLTVDQLSGGERQAFALALRLFHPPLLLLLDEHTSALDPKTSEQIMQLTQKMIHQHHITCILTTHDLDIALNYGNRLILLHNGRIHKTINAQEKMFLTKNELIGYYY